MRGPVKFGSRGYTERARLVLRRDGWTCQCCGTTIGPLHVDHIVPRELGGGSEMGNLRTLCRDAI